jgi:hypothetical protein
MEEFEVNPTIYRQGDVLLIRVDEIPKQAKLRKADSRRAGFVLAEGEVTGHHHVLEGPRVQVLDVAQEVFARIMEAPATVTHPEHATVTIPPGEYEVRRQVEYEPGELPRQVLD